MKTQETINRAKLAKALKGLWRCVTDHPTRRLDLVEVVEVKSPGKDSLDWTRYRVSNGEALVELRVQRAPVVVPIAPEAGAELAPMQAIVDMIAKDEEQRQAAEDPGDLLEDDDDVPDELRGPDGLRRVWGLYNRRFGLDLRLALDVLECFADVGKAFEIKTADAGGMRIRPPLHGSSPVWALSTGWATGSGRVELQAWISPVSFAGPIL